MPTIEELGQKVKLKYPDAYKDMSDADVGAKVQAKYPDAYKDFTPSVATPATEEKPGAIEQIGTSVKNQAKGLFDVLSALVDPTMAAKIGNGIIDSHVEQWNKAKEEYKAGNYASAAHRALAAAVPIVGPMLEQTAEKAKTAPYEAATDIALPLAAGIAAPKAIGAAGRIASRAGGAVSEGLMKSALKPGVADAPTLADVRQGVRAALENEIPATEKGVSKLQDLIADYGKKTKAVIDARTAQGATVSPQAVADRLGQINTNQVLPEGDIATINKAKQAFMARKGASPAQPPVSTGVLGPNGQPIMRPGAPANPGTPIPLDVAQAEKQGTYQQLKGKYGELSQAQVESEKALARGYKEEMEAQAPELKLLNEKESTFLGLQPMLERAVRRAGNADLVGMKDVAEIGTGGVLAGPAGAAAGLTARALDFPGLKSRLAIAINKASQKTGAPLSLAASAARAAVILSKIGQTADASENK